MPTLSTKTRGWITRAALADLLGISVQAVEHIQRKLPPDACRRVSGKWLLHGRTAVLCWAGSEPGAGAPAAKLRSERDEWRLRRERIEVLTAELRHDRELRRLVPLADVEAILDSGAALIRQAGERACGSCRAQWEEALSDFGRGLSSYTEAPVDEAE